MGMGFAPTWLRQVSPHPLLHKTTLTTGCHVSISYTVYLQHALSSVVLQNRGGLDSRGWSPSRIGRWKGSLAFFFILPSSVCANFFLYYVRSKSGYVTKFNDYGSIARKCIRPK